MKNGKFIFTPHLLEGKLFDVYSSVFFNCTATYEALKIFIAGA